jgi:ribosome biogenesis GTPase
VRLQDLGWNAYFEALWSGDERREIAGGKIEPARVVSQQRGLWRIAGEFGECWGEPSGKLRAATEVDGEVDWPAVGDWVGAEVAGGNPATLHATLHATRHATRHATLHWVLLRRGCFSRKAPGRRVEQQVIAANIDTAFLVAALDADFSPRRLERYLAQCWESGVRPVIVLNKADECNDVGTHACAAERVAMGAAVIALSARTGQGMEILETFLAAGQTIVLLGSSGVGKSTLVNRLLQEEKQAVRPTRESDSKGRHTTTARELFRLPGGALLMDTPGLREFALWNVDAGLSEAFADIEALARECHFSDCRHEGEPGCAVRAALERGTLDEARVENRRKLEREQEFQRRKSDPEAMHEYRTKLSRMMRGVRQKYKQRGRDGKL